MEIWSKCDICGRDIPVGELCYGLKKGNCICKDCCTGFENCTFTLAPAPTLTPPNEWVSVEERLPEESDGMVLFTNGRAVTSGYRNHMFRMSDEEGVYAPAIRKGGGYMRVTHWMPLPAPPGKGNNVPTNEPLTIEELREMDGEPVWVERENAWGIVEIQEGKPFIFGTNFECGYSPHWNIYRRPPEGEA